MTERPLRDIGGEAIRRERLGLIRPFWDSLDEPAKENYRRRWDHMMRVINMILGGDPHLPTRDDYPEIASVFLHGVEQKERVVRFVDGKWSIILIDHVTRQETEELRFTISEALIMADGFLQGNPDIAKTPGIGRILAAALLVFAAEAGGMK